MSVGDKGGLPTRPRNRRGYALRAHTLGKMSSSATGERSNMEIRTIELKIQLYGEIVSGRKYIPHSLSPLNVSVRMYIPHSRSKENVSVHKYITHSFPVKSFALLNVSHMVRRRNYVAKAIHHT